MLAGITSSSTHSPFFTALIASLRVLVVTLGNVSSNVTVNVVP